MQTSQSNIDSYWNWIFALENVPNNGNCDFRVIFVNLELVELCWSSFCEEQQEY